MGNEITKSQDGKAGSELSSSDRLANWLEALIEYMDGQQWQIKGIVSLPDGVRQESECPLFDHEYVEQTQIYDDSYHGHLYFPLGGQMGGYLQVYFF